MSEIYRYNTNSLLNSLNTLKDSHSLFNNNTFQTYQNSYLNNCNDNYVSTMNSKLHNIYIQIDNAYEKLSNWLEKYLDEIKTTEEKIIKSTNNIKDITITTTKYKTIPLINPSLSPIANKTIKKDSIIGNKIGLNTNLDIGYKSSVDASLSNNQVILNKKIINNESILKRLVILDDNGKVKEYITDKNANIKELINK